MKLPSALYVVLCLIVTGAFCEAANRPTTQAAYVEYQTAMDKAERLFTEATLQAERKYLHALDMAFKAAMKDADLDSANQISAAKKEIEQKISTPDSALLRTVDLLPFIDVHRDAVVGQWRIDRGELFGDDTEGARIEIPYEPPAEYDLVVDFTRIHGNNDVDLICYHPRTQFLCVLAGFENKLAGFEKINGAWSAANPSTAKLSLEDGRRYEAIIRVRNDGIKVYLDGKLLTQYTTDYSDMSSPRQLHDSVALGVGSWNNPTVFHKIQLIEISGHGHEIK